MYDLRCFGGASLRTSGGTDVRFRSRKHLALLLYLGAHTGRPLDRRFLASLLWETEESLARHSLSQALYDLRSNVASLRLDTVSGSLRFRDDSIRYEAARLEEAIRSGDLATAVQLYRGDFAPNLDGIGTGEFERWLESERDRFRRLAQISFRRFVEECDLRGQWGEMCLTALRLVKLDPLDEEAHRALMRALWLHGDQQSALKHFSDYREFLVRELPTGPSRETLDLVERIRSSRPPAEPETGPVTSELPLIGREEEFEQLRKAVRRIRREGKVAVVRGEAGIGKTRLLTEVGRLAPVEGITLLTSRCYPAESDVAYGPVVDAVQPLARHLYAADAIERSYYQLGHLFPDVFSVGSRGESVEAVDPGVRRRRMFEEVADLLRGVCVSSPVMWIVEDVQWIDRSSASLLHYVSRRLAAKPFLLILSVRSEADLGEAAARLLRGNETDPPPLLVELGPLSADAVTELISTASRGAGPVEPTLRIIRKYAGGNPFYALEILRATTGVEGKETGDVLPSACISDRLRTVLASRLRGLSSEALRILEAVAALDRHAAPEHVASVAGLSLRHAADVVSDLHGRGILHESETRYEFAHDITREFVYGNLGLLRRAALHLTTAEILAKDSTVSPATLARHFERGRDQARAYEYAMRAAEASASTCAHAEAAAMAELASSVAADDEQRLSALRFNFHSLIDAGSLSAAVELGRQLLSTADERMDQDIHAINIRVAQALIEAGAWEEAGEYLRYSPVPKSRAHERQIEVTTVRLRKAILTNQHTEAAELFSTLSSALGSSCETLPEAVIVPALCMQVVYMSLFSSVWEARNQLAGILERIDSVSPHLRNQLLTNSTMVSLRLADWESAKRSLDQILRIASETNDLVAKARAYNNLTYLYQETGHWDEALECGKAALELDSVLRIGKFASPSSTINLAAVYFFSYRFEEAEETFQKALVMCRQGGGCYMEVDVRSSLGLIALYNGKEEDAKLQLDVLEDILASSSPIEERYKYEWLRSYFQPQRAKHGTRARLRTLAKAELRTNVASALKLRLLAELSCSEAYTVRNIPQDLRADLRARGLGWFTTFCCRWYRSIASSSSSSNSGRRNRRPLSVLRGCDLQPHQED